jgi:hypothetical protein
MSEAKKEQGSEYYPGVDNWKPHVLKAGTFISQLDYRAADVINKREATASNYFSEGIGVFKIDNKPSARHYAEQVQVKPFRAPFSKEHTYPQHIALYQVKKDIECERSIVKNNPLYGAGGAVQYFIRMDRSQLQKENLELKQVFPTSQHNHNLSFFKKAEEFKLNDQQIKQMVPKAHEHLIQRMEKGSDLQKDQAKEMRKLMQDSKELKEGKPAREQHQDKAEKQSPVVSRRIKRGL